MMKNWEVISVQEIRYISLHYSIWQHGKKLRNYSSIGLCDNLISFEVWVWNIHQNGCDID